MNKVLIVDDQNEIRRLMRLTLSKRYALFEAENADQAWATVELEQPDALILDVMMPGTMDGYELCRLIKADSRFQETYVILVTARGQESDRLKGMESGADAYFTKPFSPLSLVKHLDDALGADA